MVLDARVGGVLMRVVLLMTGAALGVQSVADAAEVIHVAPYAVAVIELEQELVTVVEHWR